MRERLPHRPRRYWRYVSPQRRGAALLILALLITAVYGYWYLTNDSRIRRQARRYLRDITGARVSIDRASVDVPSGPGVEPFFRARRVVLKHRSWSVFFGGRIKPTEIVSLDAEVIESPASRAFMRARSPSKPGGAGPMDLPVIRVDSCRFRRTEFVEGVRRPEKQFDLEVDLIPQKERTAYDVYITERKDKQVAQKYHIELQLAPKFKAAIIAGAGDLLATTDALPPEYRKWLADYQIKGRYSFEGPVSVSDSALEGVLKLKLEDVSFKLPKAQGGLSLSNVSGTLIFTPPDKSRDDELKNGRIKLIEHVTGRLDEAGGAAIRLSGQYLGYRLDSPFRVNVEIDEMSIPAESPHPHLDKLLKRIHRDFSPVGRTDMTVTISRDAGKDDVLVSGVLSPRGMSATHRWVPYRVDEIVGKLHFNNDQVVLKDVVCKREGGTFTVNAVAPLRRSAESGKWEWLATVDVDSARLTEAMHKALPKKAFVGKPYPLRNIKGQVHARHGRVWVDQDRPLRTRGQGDMRCNALYGEVLWGPKGANTDIYIEADDVPIDEALIDTLNQAGRDAIGRLNAQGVVKKLSLNIKDSPDQKLTYKMTAGLKDISVTYKGFPYSVTGVSGDVMVTPGVITLTNVTGLHKDTPVSLSGKLYPGGKKLGVDLEIKADELTVDKELYQALPSDIKGIWDSLNPSGRADVVLALNQNLSGPVRKPEYHLEIRPKGMTVTYKDFPYEFGGVTGLVIAEPKAITLRKLTSDRNYQLDGVILDKGRTLKLKINARGVPLDKKLLAAIPDEFKGAISTLKPGGTLDLGIRDLTIIRGKEKSPTTKTAATLPGVKGGSSVESWRADGSVGLHDTTVDVVFGAKKLNGTVSGEVGSDSRGLTINVNADLRKIMVGKREITDVKGRVTKKPGSPLVRVEDLQARVYGGRLAGREVMVRLSDPSKYAFSLFYQDVSLSDFINASVSSSQKRTDIKGRLEGKISMEAVAGDPKSHRAAGTVVITKGKLYKMPIMLGLMHVLYLSLPGDAAFTDGHLKYFVQGDKMVIEEIFLTGSALSIVGSGQISLSNEKLDLTFLTGPPGRMPRIAVIRNASKMLNAILKELLVIRITGTMSKPIRKALPLRSLDAILKELLSPGRAKK